MSKRVLERGAFNEQEVQRYAHADLEHFLSPLLFALEEGRERIASANTDTSEAQGASADEEEPDLPAPEPVPSPEELLLAAQEQAESIITFAQQEVEQWRHTAHAQGLASGREEGREQARQELMPALVAFVQAGQSLIVLEECLIEHLTPNLVRFALEIVEKMIGKVIEEDPHIVAAVLERARAELPHARSVRVYLHPLDQQILMECRPDLSWSGQKGGRTIEIVPTEEIERGGCRVETEMGTVDATIPVQLEEIRRQLLE